MKLSPNFSVRELCENILQPVRDHFGRVKVTSGFRSEDLCVAIGSSVNSQHARGQAADFECHTVDNKQLFEWVTNNLDYDQAILEFYTGTPESGWLHVSYNKDGNRKQKLRAFRNDAGKTQYEEI